MQHKYLALQCGGRWKWDEDGARSQEKEETGTLVLVVYVKTKQGVWKFHFDKACF
jgi:hypothetical protein